MATQKAKKKKPVKPTSAKAPTVWKFKTKASALGIFVDEKLAWVGNSDGEIFACDHTGAVKQQFKLPAGVKCLIADDEWRYAGCDNGNVYDLTGRVPRLVYEVGAGKSILWIDMFRGNVVVSDDRGGITVVDAEDKLLWEKRDARDGSGWMVRADAAGIYHGGNRGVTAYDWKGKKKWFVATPDVLFGWQEPAAVYAGTVADTLVVVSKKGKKGVTCEVPDGTPSCAASPGGEAMFGAGGDSVFGFNKAGKQLWELKTGCGSAGSMQYFNKRLYIVTTDGALACIDISRAAIARAMAGVATKAVERKAPAVKAASTELEKTKDSSKGVVVECVKVGSKLRARVISKGYHSDWFCQFPKDIREDGAKYVVDKVLEAAQGGFYRVLGDIKRLG